MYNVIKFQSPFERLKRYNSSPEVNLYKAVILQVIIDATNISNKKNDIKLALESQKWLFGNSEDFYILCDYADILPSFVQKVARKIIKLHNYNCYANKKYA